MNIWQDIRDSRTALMGFVVVGIGWAVFSAQMPAIKSQIGAGDAAFGTMGLVGAVGAVIAMWLAPFVHRLVGRWAMMVGALIMVAGFLVVGMSHGPITFTMALFAAAAGAGIADVLANAEISECEADTGRSLMNLNHGLFSASYAMAAIAVSFGRGAEWTPMANFGVMAVCILVLCPALILPKREDAADANDTGQGLPQGIVWLGGVVVLSAFLGEAASEGWSALHIERTLGGTPSEGALGPAILGTSMALGRLAGHIFAGQLSPLRIMFAASLLAAIGLALVGLAANVPFAYVGLALGGLGVSVVGPLALGLVGQSVPRRLRLAAISRAAALGYAAFFVGPPLMGFIAEAFGLRFSFYAIAGILTLVLVGILPVWASLLFKKT
ncbi:MAG: MFS transporter [Paracoccaceae bacterium]